MNSLQKKARALKPQIVKREILNYLKKIDNVFFDLNIKRLEKSENAIGGDLINSVKKKNGEEKYTGFYTRATELISKEENPLAQKIEGKPYNFLYSGDFIKGFESYTKGESIEWLSTGTGSEDKKEFFDGYEHFYGLADEDKLIVIKDYLKPFALILYRKYLIG